MHESDTDTDTSFQEGRPSKTRRKKEMNALQDLGVSLLELKNAELAKLGLPEKLMDAIREARRLTAHGARRRQMQYIGKLMREIDAEPIRAKLEEKGREHLIDAHLHQEAEDWRTRLLTEADALAAATQRFPEAEDLADLVTEARKEKTQGGPPHRQRALYRRLRQLVDTSSA